MNIESEWNGGAAELGYPIVWFQPPSQPDLDNVLPERATVGNDVHVACSNVGGSVVVLSDGVIEFSESGF